MKPLSIAAGPLTAEHAMRWLGYDKCADCDIEPALPSPRLKVVGSDTTRDLAAEYVADRARGRRQYSTTRRTDDEGYDPSFLEQAKGGEGPVLPFSYPSWPKLSSYRSAFPWELRAAAACCQVCGGPIPRGQHRRALELAGARQSPDGHGEVSRGS